MFSNLTIAGPPIISSRTSKVMSEKYVHDLMTISRVFLLIIGQNDINPKFLQPIITSIWKVMAIKKPCVYGLSLYTILTIFLQSLTSFKMLTIPNNDFDNYYIGNPDANFDKPWQMYMKVVKHMHNTKIYLYHRKLEALIPYISWITLI